MIAILRSQWRQLNELPAPLRQAFADVAAVYGVLLKPTARFKLHAPDRGLTRQPDTFVEKAARISQTLGQGLWIVGLFREDIVFFGFAAIATVAKPLDMLTLCTTKRFAAAGRAAA